MPTRILTETELRRVVGIDAQALHSVESAFAWLQQDRVSMPPVMHVAAKDRNGDIDVKSAYVKGLPYVAIKIATGFGDNAALGLPVGKIPHILIEQFPALKALSPEVTSPGTPAL